MAWLFHFWVKYLAPFSGVMRSGPAWFVLFTFLNCIWCNCVAWVTKNFWFWLWEMMNLFITICCFVGLGVYRMCQRNLLVSVQILYCPFPCWSHFFSMAKFECNWCWHIHFSPVADRGGGGRAPPRFLKFWVLPLIFFKYE